MRISRAVTFTVILVVMTSRASAYEIYQWTDDEGVVHFSQWQPESGTADVNTLTLANTNPPDYDPVEDDNSILNQAERSNSVWSRLDEKRKARIEERQKAAERAAQYRAQYYQPRYHYPTYPYYWQKPWYPRPEPYPPHRPIPHQPIHGGGNRQPANGAAARRNRGPNRVVTPMPPPRQPVATPFASPSMTKH